MIREMAGKGGLTTRMKSCDAKKKEALPVSAMLLLYLSYKD